MAELVKISELPDVTPPLDGTEIVPIVKGGVTVKSSIDSINTVPRSATTIEYDSSGDTMVTAATHVGMPSPALANLNNQGERYTPLYVRIK